ncbi:FxSxx-COOH system tetratricopeptide repeat protein [Lentzea aerocolonigenes]|uniref:FxSxx-COOH system tetratricopeptide repeat protein n=1 Tax=Lentzea aerocolonigenes TaxID=68170 RepID=UPI0004C3CF09|nr:FxSxx-COOH system tetratricopeptide repeat protein [Lentzea aerocolonigenes]MCP2246513.1 AAA ATPase domain-containing protein [Lentzea aerocolonigenes]
MARRVFISYAQESDEHRAVVRELWAFLRANGVDAVFDQVAAGQRQDWSLWMADRIREADVVLCVASEQYKLRAESRTSPEVGRGVQWEARLIRDAFYDAQQDLQKFVPVVVPGQSAGGVPDFLAPATTTVYVVEDFTLPGAEDLLRFLLGKPELPEIPLGQEPELPAWTPSEVRSSSGVVSPQIAGMAEVVGREQELTDLRAAFTAQRKSRTPVIQILTGMGGVGKTSLARAYAQRHLDDYGVVWWVRAEDPTTVDGEYRSLLELVHSPAEAKLVRDAVQRANAWLSEQKRPWLLVLDNLPDAAALRGLFPAKGNGHVLVTSQAGRWPNPAAVHPIAPLDTDAAVELLSAMSLDPDAEAASKLAAELDGLPLALTQAASFTAANGIDLATYLRFYQDRSAELHADGQPDDYPHTVATTWVLAIEKMSASARLVLDTIAYFAPDSIPVSVLRQLIDDELALTRAIGELLSHSLVTRGAEGTITVHRLIQAVTRHRLGENLDHAVQARDLVAAVLPELPLDMQKMAAWKQLRSHALAAAEHLPADPRSFDLRYDGAFLHGEMGDVETAIKQLKALVRDMTPVLGPENEQMLRARHGLARWAYLFTPSQAHKVMLSELVEAQTRVLGADHPDTLHTRHDLASTHLRLGELDLARQLFEDLLPVRTRVLGPHHERVLQSRSRLALVLAQLGRFAEAIPIHLDVIAISTTEVGALDLRTVQLQAAYAVTLGHAGKFAAARDLNAFAVEQMTIQRGPYDKLTVMTKIPLAVWTAAAGNPRLATSTLLRSLIRMRNSLGKNNPLVQQFEDALNSIREPKRKR